MAVTFDSAEDAVEAVLCRIIGNSSLPRDYFRDLIANLAETIDLDADPDLAEVLCGFAESIVDK